MGHAVDFPYPKWGLKPSLRPSNNNLIRLTHSGLRFPHDPDIEHHLSCPKLQQPIGKGERNMSQQGGLGIEAAGRGLLPKPASTGHQQCRRRCCSCSCTSSSLCSSFLLSRMAIINEARGPKVCPSLSHSHPCCVDLSLQSKL
jgi:hypothetical protein